MTDPHGDLSDSIRNPANFKGTLPDLGTDNAPSAQFIRESQNLIPPIQICSQAFLSHEALPIKDALRCILSPAGLNFPPSFRSTVPVFLPFVSIFFAQKIWPLQNPYLLKIDQKVFFLFVSFHFFLKHVHFKKTLPVHSTLCPPLISSPPLAAPVPPPRYDGYPRHRGSFVPWNRFWLLYFVSAIGCRCQVLVLADSRLTPIISAHPGP